MRYLALLLLSATCYAQDRVTGLYDAASVNAAISNMDSPIVTCVCSTNNGRNIQAPMEGVSLESCELNEGKLFQVNANGKTDQVAAILSCGLRATSKGYTEQDISSRVKSWVSESDDRINAVRDYAFNQISDLQQQIAALKSKPRPAWGPGEQPLPTVTPQQYWQDPKPTKLPLTYDNDLRRNTEIDRDMLLLLDDNFHD